MLPTRRYLTPDFADLFGNFGKLVNFEDDWKSLSSKLELDVEDRGDSYEIKANLPEVKKEDLQVSIDGNTLTIAVSKSEVSEQTEKKFLLRERRQSFASRSIVLPVELSAEDVDAKLRDGVLTLAIKKHPTKQVKKIEIN